MEEVFLREVSGSGPGHAKLAAMPGVSGWGRSQQEVLAHLSMGERYPLEEAVGWVHQLMQLHTRLHPPSSVPCSFIPWASSDHVCPSTTSAFTNYPEDPHDMGVLPIMDIKEIKPFNPKGNQPWIFIGRTDAEDDAEASILWPPMWRADSLEKTLMLGKRRRRGRRRRG